MEHEQLVSGVGTEPVTEDETVLRRILDSYMEGPRKDRISHRAFRPRVDKDERGISMVRQKYASPKTVACMPPAVEHVAALRVSALGGVGLSVLPDPILPANPGHCVVPELRSANRLDPDVNRILRVLATELSTLLGPFDCPPADVPG